MPLIPRALRQRLKQYRWLHSSYKKAERKWHHIKDWWGTKIWKKTTQVTTPLGFKLVSGLHPAYQQMREGTFEIEETKIISRLLEHVSVFVDVGANLGYYTCLAAQHGKRVVSFEPQRQNLACLMQNLEINEYQDLVEIFPLALSERPGILTLYGASGPSASLVKGWAGYSEKHRQQIPVSSMDIVLGKRFENERLFIKIDVEGAEYGVLLGAQAMLERRVKPIWLLEICLDEFHPSGMNPDYEKIFRLFFDRGYTAYVATNPPSRVSDRDVVARIENGSEIGGVFNYIFIDSSLELIG